VRNPDAFFLFLGFLPLPGSGMGTLQQLLNSDTALFDKMTAHQIYSFIQLVKAFFYFLSFAPCATTDGHDDRLFIYLFCSSSPQLFHH
jgi:hypothetical protein